MRSGGLVAAALTGLAIVAGAAGLFLTSDGSSEGPSTSTLRGLTGPLQRGLDGQQPLDLAALEPTPLPQPTATLPPPTEQPVAVVAPIEVPPADPAAVAREWLDPGFAAQVLTLVNSERAARGLSALAADAALTASAQNYAATLTQLGSLSHTAVGDISSRALASGFGGGYLGEALWFGGGSVSPEQALASWLASPAHAALIFDPAYVVAGVGCYFYQSGDVYEGRCVLDLGA
jgi:uncharacterized protein YkwD